MNPSHSPKSEFLTQLLEQKGILKIICTALSETIFQLAHLEAKTGKPYLRQLIRVNEAAVGGVVRLEGNPFKVELLFALSHELFEVIYQNIYHTELHEISSANHDLAGEILNIAFGAMDPHFRALGLKIRCSLPVIFSGKLLDEAFSATHTHALVIPFTAGTQKFDIEIYSPGSLEISWKYTA